MKPISRASSPTAFSWSGNLGRVRVQEGEGRGREGERGGEGRVQEGEGRGREGERGGEEERGGHKRE